MPFVIVELGGAPRGKGAPRASVTKDGRAFVFHNPKTRGHAASLSVAATQAMGDRLPTDENVSVSVEIRFEIPNSWSGKKRREAISGRLRPGVKPDLDNLLKQIGDAFNLIIWRDDKQIVEAILQKVYSERPGLTVAVDLINPPKEIFVPHGTNSEAGPLFAAVSAA